MNSNRILCHLLSLILRLFCALALQSKSAYFNELHRGVLIFAGRINFVVAKNFVSVYGLVFSIQCSNIFYINHIGIVYFNFQGPVLVLIVWMSFVCYILNVFTFLTEIITSLHYHIRSIISYYFAFLF